MSCVCAVMPSDSPAMNVAPTSSGKGASSAQGKVAALQEANAPVADTIFEIPDLVKKALAQL